MTVSGIKPDTAPTDFDELVKCSRYNLRKLATRLNLLCTSSGIEDKDKINAFMSLTTEKMAQEVLPALIEYKKSKGLPVDGKGPPTASDEGDSDDDSEEASSETTKVSKKKSSKKKARRTPVTSNGSSSGDNVSAQSATHRAPPQAEIENLLKAVRETQGQLKTLSETVERLEELESIKAVLLEVASVQKKQNALIFMFATNSLGMGEEEIVEILGTEIDRVDELLSGN